MSIEPDPGGISWAERDTEPVIVEPSSLVVYAASLAGLTADPASPWRAGYLALIAPGETPQRAAEMALMSGCLLVALRGYLGHFIAHPLIAAPYRDRKAGEDLMQVAREAHAVRPPVEAPQPGDVVLVNSDDGKHEHAWIYLCPGSGIDGGQVENGYQCVTLREHTITGGVDVTATYRRRVRAVIDGVKVCAAFGG